MCDLMVIVTVTSLLLGIWCRVACHVRRRLIQGNIIENGRSHQPRKVVVDRELFNSVSCYGRFDCIIVFIGCVLFYRLSSTALNNEFFNKSCQEWIERLSQGRFGIQV